MYIGISAVLVIVVALFILKSIISFSLKILGILLVIGVVAFAIWLCTSSPNFEKHSSLSSVGHLSGSYNSTLLSINNRTTQTGVIAK